MSKRALSSQDLEITHVKGSGPGGQHRNKRQTGVRILHKPTGLVVWSTERRSQGQNLSEGLERLGLKVERYYYRPDPRVPTRRTKASSKRRLESKTKRSSTKSARRRPSRDEL